MWHHFYITKEEKEGQSEARKQAPNSIPFRSSVPRYSIHEKFHGLE